jgi:hypothetical protein
MTTNIAGLKRVENGILSKILKRLDRLDKRFYRLDKRFYRLDKRFYRLDKRLDKRFYRLDKRVANLTFGFSSLFNKNTYHSSSDSFVFLK